MYRTNVKKDSYGVAICRMGKQPEILLCRRRITYEFNEFVFGKYRMNEMSKVAKLLQGMTVQEKLDIMTLNFRHIWWRADLQFPEQMKPQQHSFYTACQRKFEANFLRDNGRKLIELIQNSESQELLWEIPKGRMDKDENPLNTAMRETREESGVHPEEYSILFDISPNSYVIEAYNISYHMHFYISTYNGIEVNNQFKHRHVKEIDSVRWWTLSELQKSDTEYINKVALPILKKYTKYRKKIH